MKHLLLTLFSILTFSGVNGAGITEDPIIGLRDNISLINRKLSSGIIPNKDDLSRIRALLENNLIFKSYKIAEDKPGDIKELSEQFSLFEKLCAANENRDTCLNVLKSFRMKFNTLFGSIALTKVIESHKLKVLLFSTSVSCECTLKACARQEDEIQKLYEELSGKFEYAVIDGFTDSELLWRYGAAFLPTVIVLDEHNRELIVFEMGDSVYDKLFSLINDCELKNGN